MQAGGPSYAVELGRLDGLVSKATNVEGKLPKPTFNLNQLNSMFAANGLSQTDMIALSGKLRINTLQSLGHSHWVSQLAPSLSRVYVRNISHGTSVLFESTYFINILF